MSMIKQYHQLQVERKRSINKNSFRTIQLNIGFPKMFPKNGENYIVNFQFQQHTEHYIK